MSLLAVLTRYRQTITEQIGKPRQTEAIVRYVLRTNQTRATKFEKVSSVFDVSEILVTLYLNSPQRRFVERPYAGSHIEDPATKLLRGFFLAF